MFSAAGSFAALPPDGCLSALAFRRMRPEDPIAIKRQPSQRRVLGLDAQMSSEEAEHHAAQRVAWTAWHDDRRVACFGISETFAGVQGVAWAILAPRIGALHLPLTRFMRGEIASAGLARIELLAAANDAEAILSRWPDLDPAQLLAAVMVNPTRECAWARLLGLTPAHVLRRFGAASETCVLFERIADPTAALLEDRASCGATASGYLSAEAGPARSSSAKRDSAEREPA